MKILSSKLFIGLIIFLGISGYAFATLEDVVFPIPELGNCSSKEACRRYCDQSTNMETCVTFAQNNKLITSERAAQAKRFIRSLREGGPGECKTLETCQRYCANTANAEECLTFAQRNNLRPAQELEKARRIVEALKEAPPGSCANLERCREYCEDANHAEECLKAAERFKLLEQSKLQQLRKVQDALKADEEYRQNLRERFSSPTPIRKPVITPKETRKPQLSVTPKTPTSEELQNNRGYYTSLPQPELHSVERRPFLARLMGFVAALILGPGY